MSAVDRCPPQPLQEFAERVFRALGAEEDVAAEVARHLIAANLAGHDSHGVLRIPQYVAQVDRGALLPAARPRIVRETAVTALVDAGRGFGHFSTVYALDWAAARAGEHGLAAAAIRESTHIGRVGTYTERAAARGLIALVTVGSTGPGAGPVLPHGGRERFLGTNPWSIGVPAAGHDPFIFDAATSMIAQGKVHFAHARGAPLPPGSIVDKEGRPSTDPEDLYAGGALLPVGGPVAGHKGYGWGLASALLGGLALAAADPVSDKAGAGDASADSPMRIGGVFLLVIDPAAFGPAERYQALVGAALGAAGQTRPAPGVSEVLVPGEPELRSREERQRDGIAVPDATWAELQAVAARFDVPLPERHRA